MIKKGSLIKLIEDTQKISKSNPLRRETKKVLHQKKTKSTGEQKISGKQYDYEGPLSLQFSEDYYPVDSESFSSVVNKDYILGGSVIPHVSSSPEIVSPQQLKPEKEEQEKQNSVSQHKETFRYPNETEQTRESIMDIKTDQRDPESENLLLPEDDQITIDKDTDFEADIKRIIMEARQKKTTEHPEETPPVIMPGKKPEPKGEEIKYEHAIFDKIAQSMQMANTYDLGSILLENRLNEFDREEDLAEIKKQNYKKTNSANFEDSEFSVKKNRVTEEGNAKNQFVKVKEVAHSQSREKEVQKIDNPDEEENEVEVSTPDEILITEQKSKEEISEDLSIADWNLLKYNIIRTAVESEGDVWTKFNDDFTSFTKRREDEKEMLPELERYWRDGVHANKWAQKAKDSANNKIAWSAAYVSWVMRYAGIERNHGFRFSARHMDYIAEALRNQLGEMNRMPEYTGKAFWLYDINDKSVNPEPGDILCMNRISNGTLTNHSYNNLRNRFFDNGHHTITDTSGASHCDIIVHKFDKDNKKYLEAIGGNKSVRGQGSRGLTVNSVFFELDENERIKNPGRIFGIIKFIK